MKKLILLICFLSLSIAAWAGIDRVKRSWELANFVEDSMGISLRRGEAARVYEISKTLLPQQGVLSEVNAESWMATINVMSASCVEMIAKDKTAIADNRWLHKDFNFNAPPSIAFDASSTKKLLAEYALSFWNRDIDATEEKIITDFIEELKTQGQDELQESAAILQSVCVLVGSSFQSLIVE